jgi:hypothetical protein
MNHLSAFHRRDHRRDHRHDRRHHRRCPPFVCWRTIAFYLTLGLIVTFGAAAHADPDVKDYYIWHPKPGERPCAEGWKLLHPGDLSNDSVPLGAPKWALKYAKTHEIMWQHAVCNFKRHTVREVYGNLQDDIAEEEHCYDAWERPAICVPKKQLDAERASRLRHTIPNRAQQ